jgi:hypothetical protein
MNRLPARVEAFLLYGISEPDRSRVRRYLEGSPEVELLNIEAIISLRLMTWHDLAELLRRRTEGTKIAEPEG